MASEDRYWPNTRKELQPWKLLTIDGKSLQVEFHKKFDGADDSVIIEIKEEAHSSPLRIDPMAHTMCDELARIIGRTIDCDTPIIMEPITVARTTAPYWDEYTIRGKIPGEDGKNRKSIAQLMYDITDRVISSYISHRENGMPHEEAIETLGSALQVKVETLRGEKIPYKFDSKEDTTLAASLFSNQLRNRGYTVKKGTVKGDVQKFSIIDCLTSNPADPSLLGWGGTLLAEFRVNVAESSIELQGAGMMPPIIKKIAGEEFALHGGKTPRRIG